MRGLSNFVNSIMESKIWSFLIWAQRAIMLWTSIIMLSILGIVVFARYVMHADVFG